jgi:hypothetical protein
VLFYFYQILTDLTKIGTDQGPKNSRKKETKKHKTKNKTKQNKTSTKNTSLPPTLIM